MKILFLMLAFPKLPTHSMYTDLVCKFYNEGHEVYPVGPLCHDQHKTAIYKEGNIGVLRVKTLDLFDKNPIRKGLANVLLPISYNKAIRKYWGDVTFDVVIVPTPTVMFVDVVKKIKNRCNSKVYLILRDIFPQNAVDLGMIKKGSLLYKYFRTKERNLYQIADKIGCTSQGNVDYILKQETNALLHKLHILNNFSRKVDINIDYNLDLIKDKYNLAGKYISIFGGNMGKPQQVENILFLAKKCSDLYKDAVFLFVGNGTQMIQLQEKVKKEGLNNVRFLNKLSNEEYRELLQICNIGIISLHKNFTVPNTPYKLNDYCAAQLPILASIDYGTDLGRILETNDMGLFSYADNPKDLCVKYDILYHNEQLRKIMGENGSVFFSENMTIDVAYNIIKRNILSNNAV